MKMRRHRVFLLCTIGLCVISFLHYYKALYYVSLLRELSAPYHIINNPLNIMSGFLWKDWASPLSSAIPKEGHNNKPHVIGRIMSDPIAPQLKPEEPPHRDPDPEEQKEDLKLTLWHPSTAVRQIVKPSVGFKKPNLQKASIPDPAKFLGDLHTRLFTLQDKNKTSYFVRTKAGALCFRQGTEVVPPREDSVAVKNKRMLASFHPNDVAEDSNARSKNGDDSNPTRVKLKRGKLLVKCVCKSGWHGPYCGVPTMVYHSNLPTKERLIPRERPRRIINAINVNHEFDLLHARFHELSDVVDVFLVCESNFTAYGERRPLSFLQLLLNGTYDYIRHKILYVFLDHFPDGGRQDGWIADDYLRTFLTQNGMSRLRGERNDDVFLINDADEIPAHEGILFLKLFDGWTEPFAIHMRKSLYGFFWKQIGSLEVVSGCTVRMLKEVYETDGIRLRRREYYTMANFRKYENETGHILVQWAIGSPFHFAGWHCSWCFAPEGIHLKLVSAQNGDFPRWGDYEDKRDLNYIRELIRTGGWFDGSVQEYPPSELKDPMYAPKYMLKNYEHYRYLLKNPYTKLAL